MSFSWTKGSTKALSLLLCIRLVAARLEDNTLGNNGKYRICPLKSGGMRMKESTTQGLIPIEAIVLDREFGRETTY